jgi:N-methylhydantoinase B
VTSIESNRGTGGGSRLGTRCPRTTGLPVESLEIELIRNGLAAIADEMAITEVRAAYSTVVRDLLDFSTAVCDGEGRVLAQGLTLAIQLGAIPRFMRHLLGKVERPEPGDVYLANDPWQGGVHLPDFFFAKPLFAAGEAEPIAWAACVTHMVDVGGRYPGGISVAATSLWEEGLILPIVPLIRVGVPNEAIFDLIAANVREPVKVLGDVRAALAALDTCERQVAELTGRVGGPEPLRRRMAAFLEHGERATRAAIASLPDGEGEAVGFLDDDGVGGPPVRLSCRVTKSGDRLGFDFDGTAPQVPGGINCTVADVSSVSVFAARAALGGDELVVNDGFTRCIDVAIPEGTAASARRPAAVSARGTLVYRLTDVAVAAMTALAPERLPADGPGPGLITFAGTRADGRSWICLDFVQAGWGATADHDGVTGASHALSNTGNIPIEAIEQEFPLRVRAYAFLPDTAGAGRHAGAAALRREYDVLADGVVLNYRIERQAFPPQGAFGGGPGAPSHCFVRRGRMSAWEEIPPKGSLVFAEGDGFRMDLPAGAGYGSPTQRPSEEVDRDRRDGLLSAARAAEAYAR